MTKLAVDMHLQAIYDEIARMDRKEKDHERYIRRKWRDSYDLSKLEIGYDNESDEGIPPRILNLLRERDWLEFIYTKRYQDMHELFSDEKLCDIVKNLNDKRKEVLFLCFLQGYKTTEIAQMKGLSERNIRKLRANALEEIRMKYHESNPNIDFKRQKRYNSNKKIEKCNYTENVL